MTAFKCIPRRMGGPTGPSDLALRTQQPTTRNKTTMSGRLTRLEGAIRWMMWRLANWPRWKAKATSPVEAHRFEAATKTTPSDGFPIVARPEDEPDHRRVLAPPHERFGDPYTAVDDRGNIALQAFCRLSGLSQPDGTEGVGGDWFDADALYAAGAWLRAGPCRLEDAWHLEGDRLLRLRFAGSENGRRQHHVAAFQVSAEGAPTELMLIGEAIVGQGPVFMDLLLGDPLMPILLLSRLNARARSGDAEAAVIAFPSLLRGGLHYAELAASMPRIDTTTEALTRWDEALGAIFAPASTPFAVARIVPPPGGSGPMAHGVLTRWLGTVFGVAVGEAEPARADGGVLHIPSGAVPTLSALLARQEGDGVRLGPFLIANHATRAPRHAIALPAAVASLTDLQPYGAEPLPLLSSTSASSSEPIVGTTAFPLAICFRSPAGTDVLAAPGTSSRLKRPFDQKTCAAGDLVVLLVARDADRTANLLEDLSAQTLAALAEIRIAPLQPAAVDGAVIEIAARFGDCCSILDPISPTLADRLAAAQAAGGRYVLLVSDSVAMPDPRTLETLFVLAQADGVGAASCLLVESSVAGGLAAPTVAAGGWFATGISIMTDPTVTFSRPDILGALPEATFPVVAAGPELVLFCSEALAHFDRIAPNPVGDATLLQLALANAAEGKTHLVTTAVHALCLDSVARRDVPDPVGPGAIRAHHLVNVIDRVTAVREVKG